MQTAKIFIILPIISVLGMQFKKYNSNIHILLCKYLSAYLRGFIRFKKYLFCGRFECSIKNFAAISRNTSNRFRNTTIKFNKKCENPMGKYS
jgi:hypothetical protein